MTVRNTAMDFASISVMHDQRLHRTKKTKINTYKSRPMVFDSFCKFKFNLYDRVVLQFAGNETVYD